MKRKINVPIIKQWIRENNPNGKEKLAIATSLSASMIEKIITYKYHHELYPNTVKALAEAMKKDIDTVFPPKGSK